MGTKFLNWAAANHYRRNRRVGGIRQMSRGIDCATGPRGAHRLTVNKHVPSYLGFLGRVSWCTLLFLEGWRTLHASKRTDNIKRKR